MLSMNELLHEVEKLPVTEKWQLVRRVLLSLEQEQYTPVIQSDYHQFLRETYGSLRDTPIERWDQGDYEQREPLE
jgi:hypothetical protein